MEDTKELFTFVDGIIEELQTLRGYDKQSAQLYALFMFAANMSMTDFIKVEEQMKHLRTTVAIENARKAKN